MLRTPTHIVEIGTNVTTTTTTTKTTPLIQKLQTAAGTKYQYHDQYNKTNNNYNKNNKPKVKQQLQQSFIYQHQQQQQRQLQKEQKFQLEAIATTTVVEYQLQTKNQKQKDKEKEKAKEKQLQATKSTLTAISCNKKLKKSKKFSTSSSSSSASSTTSSLSSSGCSALSTTSSSDSSTVSAKTTKTNSSSSSTASHQTTFTFREHILSRGLLSTTPFSFMRTKKSKAIVTATAETTEIRKTSKRLFDLEDKTQLSNNDNKNNNNCETGASIPETKSTTITTTRTGYFSNIISSSCSSNSNNNNNNTKNIKNNNNNNNNYIKSFPIGKNRSITPTLPLPSSPQLPLPPLSASITSVSPLLISNTACVVAPTSLLVAVAVASPPIATTTSMSPTSQTPPASRSSLFDSCHRKIRLIGGGPVAFLGGLVAKARRKERDGDQNSSDTKLYLEESVLERKLPEADLKALVDLPAGLDYNEWLASHTLALFEHVNLVYGTISEFCTTSGCPDMTGPGNRTYLWFDEKGKKTRVAAPQYIDYVMTFTQKTVSDESIFPTKYANEFPSSFESIARKILRLQFHVIAHLYAAHFREIALLGLHTHLNLTFAHLTALHRRFNLIDEKETDVLRDLEVALRLTDDTTGGITGSGSSQNDATETNSSSTGGGGGGGVDSIKGGSLVEDVNSVQHNNLMDCNTTAQPPICTQPEANIKSQQFGGGGGLIGGILGDLSSGEFGDTMHYCTSAVPASSTINNTSSNHTSTPNTCSTNSTCTTADQQQQQQSTVGAVTANGNNGAGALNFHLNNNNHLAHHPHTHQPHHHHHHHHNNVHHHHHNHPYAQNTGLIQCNASNAPTATNATTSTTTA